MPYGSGASLVSVDGPKRGKFDRQIPIAVRESYTRALDCNGNGLCFTFETDSHVPSVKISRDRRHSPKGRAGLMREWLRQLSEQGFDPAEEVALQSGGLRFKQIVDKFRNTVARARGEYDFSHEVMEAMEGCLACKACTSQCPIKVDVPTFRARFMQLYHSRYLRGPKDYFVGTVESYAPLLAKAPSWSTSSSKRVGPEGDREEHRHGGCAAALRADPGRGCGSPRPLFRSAGPRGHEPRAAPKVVLIVQDPFTSYYDAPVVRDLVKLASKLGYQPYLLPFKPNGKPQHVKGFLRAFARTAASSAQFLNKVAASASPWWGRPSLVLCYRDEYVKALGPARGDFQVLLPQEWLLSCLPRRCRCGKRLAPTPGICSPTAPRRPPSPPPTVTGAPCSAASVRVAAGVGGLLRHGGHLWSRRQTGGELQGDLRSELGRASGSPAARPLSGHRIFVPQPGQADGGRSSSTRCRPCWNCSDAPLSQGIPGAKGLSAPHFLLLPTTPSQAVVEFVAILRERISSISCFARTMCGPPPISA
jgi:Fe-S oxidoreductase